ncbi:MAG: recombinase family protein [Firmicutes bacterium]|nr:recombinase family protein [Bacillota bacterium]
MNVVELLNVDLYEKSLKRKNVCAYARVSTSKDLQETSFDLQVETYTQMIQSNPEWNFSGVFADEGKSGTSLDYRGQFNLMVEIAKSGNIDMIITKSVSRFARNTIDCLSIIQELKKHGTEVWFEKENLSSFDPKIEFVIAVMAGMAEEESRSISENVKWGVQKRFRDGIVPMVTSHLLGYDRDENNDVVINKEEAKVIKLIFKMYSEGISQRLIAEHLNTLNLKTKFGNKPYYEGAIRGIINNERYTGNAILQKSKRKKIGDRSGEKNQLTLPKYYVENSHPEIISQKLFDEVHALKNQRILKYNLTLDKKQLKKIGTNRSEYAEFIECAICGKNYHYRINNINTIWENKILKCSSNKINKKCDNDALFVSTFDRVLLSHINWIIKNKDDFLNRLREALMIHPAIIELNSSLQQAQEKLDDYDTKLRTLMVSNDELDKHVRSEVISLKNETQIELIKLKNKLLTTHNIPSIIKKMKMILSKYKTQIDKISDFQFREIFTKARIYNRDDIELVIDPFNSSNKKCVYIYPAISTEYTIRKKNHLATSSIKVL